MPPKQSTHQGYVTLPIALNTPDFEKAWQDYVEYRRQRRLPKLVPMSVQRQWDKLSDYGVAVAIAAIEQTITNGWQGIFPDRVSRDMAADAPRSGVGGPRASLGALQMQLKQVEQELEGIFYPGGAAWQVEPSKENRERANRLLEQRKRLKLQIEEFSQ